MGKVTTEKFGKTEKTIELKAKRLKTYREMSVGLLGARNAYPVSFKTRWGIHTFFMKFAIDVVILNKENRVVGLCKNLRPFRIYLWNPAYSTVLELPSGTIEELRIKKNDLAKLKLEN